MGSQERTISHSLNHSLTRFFRWGGMCIVGVGSSLFVSQVRTPAAESLVVTYGPIQQSFLIKDLETFVETGEMSSSVRFLVNISGQEADNIRKVLDYKVGINFLVLHDILNSLPGEYVLFEAGNLIHTKSRRANIQALRAALVMSAQPDNNLSILEFLQNYPTEYMYMDGVVIARLARQISGFVERFKGYVELPIAIITDFLEGFICDCGTSEDRPSMRSE